LLGFYNIVRICCLEVENYHENDPPGHCGRQPVLILMTVVFVVVCPAVQPHQQNRTLGDLPRANGTEAAGRGLYIANGCVYCHTQSIRTIDWGMGAERIAQAGDYIVDQPILLGSQRTGPDLSQQGGEHPDDWHMAHFINPRVTRPLSIMPQFEYLGEDNLKLLTTYVQSLGLKDADLRVRRQQEWKARAIEAYEAGPEANVRWLHEHVPQGWRDLPNPISDQRGRSGARTQDLPGFLPGMPRSGRRRHGPGTTLDLPAAAQFHHPQRTAAPAAGSSTTRS
jgi:cbb3-type cytochrome c oxidase subunit II